MKEREEKKMLCNNCGTQSDGLRSFCGGCGSPLQSGGAQNFGGAGAPGQQMHQQQVQPQGGMNYNQGGAEQNNGGYGNQSQMSPMNHPNNGKKSNMNIMIIGLIAVVAILIGVLIFALWPTGDSEDATTNVVPEGPVVEAPGEPDNVVPEDPIVEDFGNAIVGYWALIDTPDELMELGLEAGWMYILEFFEDGTAVEWWFDPDGNPNEANRFNWVVDGNQLTITYTSFGEIAIHFYGDEMNAFIGVPLSSTISFSGDTLTMNYQGVTSIYQRF